MGPRFVPPELWEAATEIPARFPCGLTPLVVDTRPPFRHMALSLSFQAQRFVSMFPKIRSQGKAWRHGPVTVIGNLSSTPVPFLPCI